MKLLTKQIPDRLRFTCVPYSTGTFNYDTFWLINTLRNTAYEPRLTACSSLHTYGCNNIHIPHIRYVGCLYVLIHWYVCMYVRTYVCAYVHVCMYFTDMISSHKVNTVTSPLQISGMWKPL